MSHEKDDPTSRRGLLKAGVALVLGAGAIVQPFGGVTGAMAEEEKKKKKAKAKKKTEKKKDEEKKG